MATRSQVTPRTAATVALSALAVLAVALLLVHTRLSLALLAVAGFLAVALDPLVQRLARLRLPRTGAVILVMALLAAAGTGLVLLIVPPAVAQVRSLVTGIPGLVERVRHSSAYAHAAAYVPLDAQLEALRTQLLDHAVGSVDS